MPRSPDPENSSDPPALAIRQADHPDTEAITALTREAYSAWVAVIGREPLPMTVDYASALQSDRFDLLFSDGKLVGLIQTSLGSDALTVVNVAVSAARQGQGLGSRLMAHAETLAHDHGVTEMRLVTNGAFVQNIALYKRLGYRVDSETPFLNGTAVYMSKKLVAADA